MILSDKPFVPVLNCGHVEYVDHMGSDLTVVNAARVSFNKETDWAVDEAAKQRLVASGSTYPGAAGKSNGKPQASQSGGPRKRTRCQQSRQSAPWLPTRPLQTRQSGGKTRSAQASARRQAVE